MKDIVIEYQLIDDNSWKKFTLIPKDYFDENDGGYLIDSIEKFYLEPRNYISVEQSQIKFLNFYLDDELGNQSVTRFTYWEGGSSQIQDHCKFRNGVLIYRTIVNSIKVEEGSTLVLRVEEINNQLVPITHSINDDENDISLKKIDLSAFKSLR